MAEDARGVGDNVKKGISAQRLKSLIERIECLEEEKKAIGADIREIYLEARSQGFDPKVMRAVIKKRAQNAADVAEFESLLQVYMDAVGDYVTTELGQAGLPQRHG